MRVYVTKIQLVADDGPGDADTNPSFGIDVTVYDTTLKRTLSTFIRATNAALAGFANQAAVTTAVNNAIIAKYAAQGITITALDIARP